MRRMDSSVPAATRLRRERRDGVLALTLDRPECLNAIDGALARALLHALQEASCDPELRVILLRGNGRAFCAGRDVRQPPTDEDLVLVQQVATAIVAAPQPVVAAVHGWVVGAGLEWMLDADLVIAARSARFKLPEASLGVFVTGGLMATLPAAVGLSRAKALMLLGEPFDAEQAVAWGLAWKMVEDAELERAGWETAAALARLDSAVAAEFKKVLNSVGLAAFERAVAEERRAQRALQARG
jgi:2-(1,2-epoxy-1,2-dihydrophenyl)acetyl-CoA isomerase